MQACEVIAEAHRSGLVHRDLKLANLFLLATRVGLPRIKVLDFGVGRITSEAGAPATFGTPHYMAPERVLGIDDDPRSDLWSLGVVLYELVTGHKPFQSPSSVELLAAILSDHHVDVLTTRTDLPPRLVEVIDRCLTKDPELRYQSAGELASALAPLAPVRAQVHVERALEFGRPQPPLSSPSIESARSSLARSSQELRASRPNRPSTVRPSVTPVTSTRRGSSQLLVWGIAAVAIVVGVVLFLKTRGSNPSAAALAATPEVAPVLAAAEPARAPDRDAPTAAVTPTTIPATPASAPKEVPVRSALVSRAAAARGVVPAPVPTPAAAPVATPATAPAASQARPGLEADPWRKAATPRAKLDEWPPK